MKKLKGVRKLNKVVNDFTKQFGITFSLGTEFEVALKQKHGWYAVAVKNDFDTFYTSYIKGISGEKIPIFLISLLHEIGHFITKDFFDEDDIDDEFAMKYELAEKYKEVPCVQYAFEYFSLSTEEEATNWAIAYYKLNKAECINFYNNFLTELYKFYKINNAEQ